MAVTCAAATTMARRAQYRVLLYIDGLYLHKYTSGEEVGAREVKPAARVLLRARCDVATDAHCKCAFEQCRRDAYMAMAVLLSSFLFFFYFFFIWFLSPFFFFVGNFHRQFDVANL